MQRVLNGWSARLLEIILDPELPIIDPQHHLWDRRTEAAKGPQSSGDGAP